MMKWFRSLRRRVVVTFVLLATSACLLFAIIASVAVEGIEVHLVDDRLASVAAWASPRHAGNLPVEMPAGLSFYHGASIPKSLRNLPLGVHEISVDGADLQVLAGKDTLGDYVVVDNASQYEKVELVVYSAIGIGLLGFLLLSLFLGRYVARRIVTPITTLADATRDEHSVSSKALLTRKDEIGDLARAFETRTQELKDFLDRERFFTGDVSHELRTPLTVIIGAAEVLMTQTGEQPALHAASERILRTAKEAADSITVLLLLARTPELIDAPETQLSNVIRSEVERSQAIVAQKPVKLTYSINSDFSVFARRELLAAAVGNLIRNACQYTAEGRVNVLVDEGAVVVEDTGPGIPDFVLARLNKGAPVSEPAGSAGSGLGLALVMRICEHIKADLHGSLRPEGGTRFSLRF